MLDDFFCIDKQKEDTSYYPIYTRLDVPKELNPTIGEIRRMEDDEFYRYIEQFRVYLLEKYEKERIPVGGNNMDMPTIIHNFKGLKNLNIFSSDVYTKVGNQDVLIGYSNFGNAVNCWFPEMRDVKLTKGTKTVQYSIIDILRDEKLWLSKAHRILRLDAMRMYKTDDIPVYPTFANCIKLVSGAQPLTNIRMPVAKWIWQHYMLENQDNTDELVVWDPSMGWAGRLVAFLAASSHPNFLKKRMVYIGTDPNTTIFERYGMVEKFWKSKVDPTSKAEIYPICKGSEEFHTTPEFGEFKGRGLIAYTSPPYFNRERYSDDPNQSYIKFSNYELWRDGFLRGTIQNAYDFLGSRGKLFWNVADIRITKKVFHPLESDSIRIAEDIGFTYEGTIAMLMRSIPGRDETDEKIEAMLAAGQHFIKVGGKWNKWEPILIFSKKKN